MVIMMLIHPLPGRVTDGTYAAGIGDEDRGLEETRFGDPMGTRHVPVAIEGIPVGIDRVEVPAAGQDSRYARPHRALALYQGAVAADDGGLAHGHARNIGDRIVGAGLTV